MKTQTPANKEIEYLRFLNNTLQIKHLRKELCDEFTRKIFYYINTESRFDSHVFCAFLYKFIHKCQLYKSLFMTRQGNIYDKIRLESGKIENELYLFLNLHTIKFALSSVDPNQFPNISIEEKLKHLTPNNEKTEKLDLESQSLLAKLSRKNNSSWKKAIVKIIVPEIRGNAKIVPYLDLEFILWRLSTEQKLDVIHFTICALNYLSQKDEPIETYSNPMISDAVLVSKPEHLKSISDKLIILRDNIILNAFRDKESNDEIFDEIEFSQDAPDVARILQAQTIDCETETQWLSKNFLEFSNPSLVFFRKDIKQETNLLEPSEKERSIQEYPPSYRKRIIDSAVRLYEKSDEWKELDLLSELKISKSTLDRQKKFFNLKMPIIRDEALAIIREKENSQK